MCKHAGMPNSGVHTSSCACTTCSKRRYYRQYAPDSRNGTHVGHVTGHRSLPAACAGPASSSRPAGIDVSASSRHSLHLILRRWCGQMPTPRTPCIASFRAGAGRCPPPRTPCMCFFGAGAGRCSRPRTPCIGSFGAGAGRCTPPRTPCICSGCAGAGRCPPPPILMAGAGS